MNTDVVLCECVMFQLVFDTGNNIDTILICVVQIFAFERLDLAHCWMSIKTIRSL